MQRKMLRNELGMYFELKEESIGPPTIYLGEKLSFVPNISKQQSRMWRSIEHQKGNGDVKGGKM